MLQEISCPDPRQLEQFDIGALADEDADSLERHLAQCEHCVHTLETLHGRDTLTDAVRAQGTLTPRPTSAESLRSLMHRLKDLCPAGSLTTSGPTALDQTPRPGVLLGRPDYGFLAPPQEPDEMGRLGAYRVLRVLGIGGMGIVFQAEDSQLHRLVALKVLHPAWAQDPSARRRFVREGQAAAAITHDNLVPIYQVGDDRGVPFLAMQLLRGETLEARWRRLGKLAPAEIRRIGREIAEGLAAAHQCGLIHRDIKPANIWLEVSASGQAGAADRVKILDFGLARPTDDAANLTDPGVFVGTPLWVAPEQADSRVVDGRADLFSLGSVLYALATGRAPFQAETSLGMLRRVCDTTPQPVHEVNPEVPVELSEIIAKLHAKSPADRFQTAAEVAQALRGDGEGDLLHRKLPPKRSRLWLVAAGVALLVAAGLSITEGAGITQVSSLVASVFSGGTADSPSQNKTAAAAHPAAPRVFPAALFPFEDRPGAKDYAAKVNDLLFAKLGTNPAVVLVERSDLNKLLAEQSLNLSGIVNPGSATRVGRLTGAKIIIAGSVVKADKTLHLIARVAGTETSRVLAVSVTGSTTDSLPTLVDKLASEIADTITRKADQLVARVVSTSDRIKALSVRLKKAARPTVWINVNERHVGQTPIDPAAQTELMLFAKGCEFQVIDPVQGAQAQADILITGNGISELAGRHGNLVSAKARVELKAVERATGKVLAVDRQNTVAVDLTEQIAAKTALQEAAAALAERVLPKLVK